VSYNALQLPDGKDDPEGSAAIFIITGFYSAMVGLYEQFGDIQAKPGRRFPCGRSGA
jgi:hypothetical protein